MPFAKSAAFGSRCLYMALIFLALDPASPAISQDCTSAGTPVPGGPVSGVWTAAGSPYRVMGTLTVNGLTIEDGVCIVMEGDHLFNVTGSLTTVDNTADPILFTATDTMQGWQGIKIESAGGPHIFRQCIIQHANTSGMRLIDSTATIVDCTFQLNRTNLAQGGGRGGGLFADLSNLSSDLTIQDCTFQSNECINPANNDCGSPSTAAGGAIWVKMGAGRTFTLDGCIVRDNIARNPDVGSFCNTTAIAGGLFVSGDAMITNCTVSNNEAHASVSCACGPTARGGGAYFADGTALLQNCRFLGNRATTLAGGVTSVPEGGALYLTNGLHELTNCVLGCNSTRALCDIFGMVQVCPDGMFGIHNGSAGAGVFVDASSQTTVTNCTIVRNSDGTGQDTIGPGVTARGTATVTNAILWYNNSDGQQVTTQSTGVATVTFSDVQNGYPGTGNILLNPGFPESGCDACDFDVPDPATGAFSPCVDAGDPSPQYNDVCFPPSFGNSAPTMHMNDMGARGGPGACNWCAPGATFNYCLTSPNSAGPGAIMSSGGSTSIANNNLVLMCTGCPPNKVGVFYYGCHQQTQPMNFGNGFRCVAGQITRLAPVVANSGGTASFAVDFPTLPLTGTIGPGDIRDFQFWYRDPAAGGAFFNLSDGLEIPFCP